MSCGRPSRPCPIRNRSPTRNGRPSKARSLRCCAALRGPLLTKLRARWVAAAHGPGPLLRNPEEEARAHPCISRRRTWTTLSHCRAGAGMSRAIPATACREALSRLPTLDIGELRQQWRSLYKTPAPANLSRELLLRAVAYRMQEVALGGLRPARQRQLRQMAQQSNRIGA